MAAGLGGLLGVNRGLGAAGPLHRDLPGPRPGAKASLALVGKGITFDSGRPVAQDGGGHDHHEGRHGRGRRHPRAPCRPSPPSPPSAEVTGYIPTTDNMTGGDATRVGDVLRIRNGKTVEVLNTDAEGRLILADGLAMASEAEPDAIVDLATLTGAVMVALGLEGRRADGLDTRGWVDQIRDAADRTRRAGVGAPPDRGVPPAARLGGRRPEEHRQGRRGGHHPGRAVPARVRGRGRSPGPTSTSPAPRGATPTTWRSPRAAPARRAPARSSWPARSASRRVAEPIRSWWGSSPTRRCPTRPA